MFLLNARTTPKNNRSIKCTLYKQHNELLLILYLSTLAIKHWLFCIHSRIGSRESEEINIRKSHVAFGYVQKDTAPSAKGNEGKVTKFVGIFWHPKGIKSILRILVGIINWQH